MNIHPKKPHGPKVRSILCYEEMGSSFPVSSAWSIWTVRKIHRNNRNNSTDGKMWRRVPSISPKRDINSEMAEYISIHNDNHAHAKVFLSRYLIVVMNNEKKSIKSIKYIALVSGWRISPKIKSVLRYGFSGDLKCGWIKSDLRYAEMSSVLLKINPGCEIKNSPYVLIPLSINQVLYSSLSRFPGIPCSEKNSTRDGYGKI